MQITLITDHAYYTDGGTIALTFSCSDGNEHRLDLCANNDIVLDEQIVTRLVDTLRSLRQAIHDFRKHDKRKAATRPMRPNTFAFGADLNAMLTSDAVGQEQMLLGWAEERLVRKIQECEQS